MYETAASCKDIARAPVTNWEPQCVTLAGYCYAVAHGMKVQLVTPYRVGHLPRYGVTVRGNVTSVYPPLRDSLLNQLQSTKSIAHEARSRFEPESPVTVAMDRKESRSRCCASFCILHARTRLGQSMV
jgi:hypothetical protein